VEQKVFEFAKEIGMETLALMDKIREWKLPVKSHMSTLDEGLISEIRTRLSGEEEAAAAKKPAKKKTVKKTATEGAAKKIAKPKTAKAAKTAKAEGATTGTLKKPTRKKAVGVIRRKAGELEAKAAAEAEAVAQAIAEENRVAADVQETGGGTEESGVSATEATPGAEEPRKPRGNIVGRMDLRRVVTPSGAGPAGAGPGGGPGGAFAQRSPRTATRNIRTGFVAPMPMEDFPVESEVERREKEEKERKKKAGTGREEQPQVFTATEFRKREVIFQPKKKKPVTGRDARKTQITTPKASKRIVKVHNVITVADLANQMSLKAPVLIKKLVSDGVMATVNTELDFDTVALIAPEFGWEAMNVHKSVNELLKDMAFGDLDAAPVVRPPVVTVMGHVDHGKTTLLDAIRQANVAQGEAGGITQHIGAYSVKLDGGKYVTFIDTPGHEAFTAMRARGANVTDIAIIVVAADDGMMPQTVEAINHAKAAGVPIIVAVNKMDRPGANPDRIKQQLTEVELVPEEWGGTTIYCPVSALKKEGIKELLEQIHVVAEVQDLKANPNRSATGVVIESRMEKGRGPVATLLVKNGTLRVGDIIVAGGVTGRVRSQMNDKGQQVKEVPPGFAAEIMGFSQPSVAGDRFDVCETEELARQAAQEHLDQQEKEQTPSSKMSIEELFAKVKTGETKELSIVLKADVAGSLEAIKGMIDKAQTEKVKVKVIHSAIGGITESDVLLAGTANGLIVGFNVRPDGEAQRMAKEKGVEIKSYSIIYELMDDLKKIMSGLLDPTFSEKEVGRAEVRNTFVVPKVGTIAGCFVQDGKITRGNQVRLVRDGRIVYEGKLSSLKRFKDDVREVASGFECGIGIENFNDIKVGDVIEAFIMEQTEATL